METLNENVLLSEDLSYMGKSKAREAFSSSNLNKHQLTHFQYFLFFLSKCTCRVTVKLTETSLRILLQHMYKHFTLVLYIPLVIRRKLSVYKTFRKQPRPLLNVLCTFNSSPVSRRQEFIQALLMSIIWHKKLNLTSQF